MLDSFGDLLLQFAQSVDYLTDREFDEMRDVIEEYTSDVLHITSTRFMVLSRDSNTGEERLTALRNARRGKFQSIPIGDDDKGYSGHCAYSYRKRKPLWVISGNEKLNLVETDIYVDKWSGSNGIPKYRSIGENEIKTSIIIPTKDVSDDIYGVLNFETTELLDLTETAKKELVKIANALSLTYSVLMSSRAQQRNTREALNKIKKMQKRQWPKLTKPKVFLASSSRADRDVIEAIQEIFQQPDYAGKYHLIFWENMNKPGNINSQLLEELSLCQYGICYFSEPKLDDKGNHLDYADNANVIFEAGMLHGRSNAASITPVRWIPIRDKGVQAPFDFRNERMVEIDRDKNSQFNKQSFVDKLSKLIDNFDSE